MKKYALKLLGASLVFGIAYCIFCHLVPVGDSTILKEWLGISVLLGGGRLFWDIMR